jgi:hypothetical protein
LAAVFLFIFSGLFCGFLVAHFFPEHVIRFIYGVGTEAPAAPEPIVAVEPVEAPASPTEESRDDDGGRERELSASSRSLSAMEALELPKVEPVKAVDNAPRFAKHRKPLPPGADTPVLTDLAVSSFMPAAQYPAAEWRGVEMQTGFVDNISIASKGGALGDAKLMSTDTLEIVGWTGDTVLGLRFKDVLFSMCGKIIGHTKVGLSRPDVVKAVHPNLLPSGWRGRLYVGYLPQCPNPTLQVLAVVPGSMTVTAVGAPITLKLPAPEKPSAAVPKGAPLFTPKNVSAARFTSVDVLPDNAELRRCGASDCPTVGQIPKGRYQAYAAEEADGWMLLILRDKAGWLPRSQLMWVR